jgi:hypothetical protein
VSPFAPRKGVLSPTERRLYRRLILSQFLKELGQSRTMAFKTSSTDTVAKVLA